MRRIIVLFLVFVSTWSLAQEPHAEKVWYLGAGLGMTTLAGNNLNQLATGSDDIDADTGLVLTGGYRLSENLALEVSYIDGGEPRFTAIETPPCPEAGFCIIDAGPETRVVTASVLVILPLTPFELFAKGGVASWDASSTIALTSEVDGASISRQVDRTGSDFMFGVGAGFTVSDKSHLRFTAQLFSVDRTLLAVDRPASINQFLLEYHWRF